MSYEKKTSDDGVVEYYEDGELIAFINDSGKLQATHGKAKQKPGLEQWIDETGDGSDEDATEGLRTPEPDETAAVIEPTGEPASSADDVPSEYNQEAAENVIEDRAGERAPERALPIICPIVGDPMLGDKDPQVVQWWKDNHPEEFKNRYSGRRLQSQSGIIY